MTTQPFISLREPVHSRDVMVKSTDVLLNGILTVPAAATGIVMFAHGSGSSRFSTRNRQVAASLNARDIATLLFDLLTVEEEAADSVHGRFRFDIPMLASRLAGATDWLLNYPATRDLKIGYFGASTGGAAALVAAAAKPDAVSAVVSRGGRPDLAGDALSSVRAPTLLIVGGLDVEVIELNRQAMSHMAAVTELAIISRATHLFPEPGALEQVSELAGNWFARYLK